MNRKLTLPYASHRIFGENDLDAPTWREIKNFGRMIKLAKNSTFEPETSTAFYCIEKGSLRADFMTLGGRQRSLLIFEAGAIINLAHAVLGEKSFTRFKVRKDSILWQVDNKTIMTIPESCPHLKNLCLRILASSNMTYEVALAYLDVDDFKIRFCRYLALCIRRYGDLCFSTGLTQEECAMTLGVHRATLARAVQALKKDGIIACFTQECVQILDAERLLQQADL